MTLPPSPLRNHVALVAGATRGAGRAIAVELGALGATVYCTGRTTRTQPSPMNRPEAIEDSADLVDHAEVKGIARCDHSRPEEVLTSRGRFATGTGGSTSS